MELLTAIAVGTLFGVAIFQVLRRNLIRSAIGLVLLSGAVNLFLLAAGAYNGLDPAYTGVPERTSDALPQAMVLTAIVISMGGLALVLSMLYIVSARYKTSDMDDVAELKH